MTAAASPVVSPGGFTSGSLPSRLQDTRFLVVFLAVFAVLVIGGALVIAAAKTAAPSADCEYGKPCANPPTGTRLLRQTLWRSTELGFSLEYDRRLWTKTAADGRGLTLAIASPDVDATVTISGAPAAQAPPQALLDAELAAIRQKVPTLASDPTPARAVLGPGVGYVDGVGGPYAGTIETGQGPGAPLLAAVMAAGDRRLSVVLSYLTTADPRTERKVAALVDSLLNTMRWNE